MKWLSHGYRVPIFEMEHWHPRDHSGQVNDLYRRQCRGER